MAIWKEFIKNSRKLGRFANERNANFSTNIFVNTGMSESDKSPDKCKSVIHYILNICFNLLLKCPVYFLNRQSFNCSRNTIWIHTTISRKITTISVKLNSYLFIYFRSRFMKFSCRCILTEWWINSTITQIF